MDCKRVRKICGRHHAGGWKKPGARSAAERGKRGRWVTLWAPDSEAGAEAGKGGAGNPEFRSFSALVFRSFRLTTAPDVVSVPADLRLQDPQDGESLGLRGRRRLLSLLSGFALALQ